jgi:hypothetical protein
MNNSSEVDITSYNYNKQLNNNKIKYEQDLFKEKYNKFYKKNELKSQLLNIDSKFRNIYPKNIYKTNNQQLNYNPVYTTKNSNIIKINYVNHSFNVGDSVIVKNVIGNSEIFYENIL